MTTSRILACYQTRKTPDFAPTQQFAMDKPKAARYRSCSKAIDGCPIANASYGYSVLLLGFPVTWRREGCMDRCLQIARSVDSSPSVSHLALRARFRFELLAPV